MKLINSGIRLSLFVSVRIFGCALVFALSGYGASVAADTIQNAGVPASANSLVWIEQKVAADEGAKQDNFGASVAVSGNTAVIGVQNAAVGDNFGQGDAYVFTKSKGIWTQVAKLTANDGAAYDRFGKAVAISGTTILIGAANADINSNGDQGAVYVFTESGGAWNQTAKLVATDGAAFANFGGSVSVDDDTALVGAPYATIAANSSQGTVYVFTDTNGVWSQVQKLTSKDGAAGDYFGYAVALGGSTALIGAKNADISGNSAQGAAYIFVNKDGSWTQTHKLTASDGALYGNFGQAVALYGSTAIIGSPGATVGGNAYQGSAYIFTGTGGAWTEAQELTADDGAAQDNFGRAVAISNGLALVGANNARVGGFNFRGAAYIFSESGGAWSQAQKLIATDGSTSDQLGYSVALDNTTALVGAENATIGSNAGQGAAYFYGQSNLNLTVNVPQDVYPGDDYLSRIIAANNADATSPPVNIVVPVPAAASYVSAVATQGKCSEADGNVSCDFGPIDAQGGTATANIKLKAVHIAPGTIEQTARVVAQATPPLSASATTAVVARNAPVANDGSASTNENKSVSGTLQATSPDGASLSFSIVVPPSNGTVKITDATKGSYVYTPNKDYSGKDSFGFQVSDGHNDSNTATVVVTVKRTDTQTTPPDNSGDGNPPTTPVPDSGGGGASAPLGLWLLALLSLAVSIRRRR